MDTTTQELILGILFMLSFLAIVITVARYVYRLRKLRIEYGIEGGATWGRDKLVPLAGTLIGLGAGLLLASVASTFQLPEDTADLLGWGIIVLSTGGGLLAAYHLSDGSQA